MTKFCTLVLWILFFICAFAISQFIASFSYWASLVVGVAAVIVYTYSMMLQNELEQRQYQVIAVGIAMGWARWQFGI